MGACGRNQPQALFPENIDLAGSGDENNVAAGSDEMTTQHPADRAGAINN